MKTFTGVLCALAISASVIPAYAVDRATLETRLTDGAAILNEVMGTPDKGIPQSILAGASCVVVIPHYKKGAFVVGAQYGKGVALVVPAVAGARQYSFVSKAAVSGGRLVDSPPISSWSR